MTTVERELVDKVKEYTAAIDLMSVDHKMR